MMIAAEAADDQPAIRAINDAAFGRPDESDLIDRLRDEGAVVLSLVASFDGQPVGHLLFSRMWIDTPGGSVPAVALAPLAVIPAHQRSGIGGALVRHGLDELTRAGERVILVLGHAAYYPRFGFSSERARALEHPFPPGALMALELRPGALDGSRGRVRYASSFGL
jgi:putative acetyltransferase